MKLVIISIITTVFISVFLIRKSGYNPKPILVMKASQYENNKVLGRALFKRFYQEVKNVKDIAIICEPKVCDQINIWDTLYRVSNASGISDRKLFNDFTDDKNSDDPGKTLTYFKSKPSLKFSKETMLFYMTDFFLSKSTEVYHQKCNKNKKMDDIDCLKIFFSRRYYRKKFKDGLNYVGMEKISSNKYVMYLKN